MKFNLALNGSNGEYSSLYKPKINQTLLSGNYNKYTRKSQESRLKSWLKSPEEVSPAASASCCNRRVDHIPTTHPSKHSHPLTGLQWNLGSPHKKQHVARRADHSAKLQPATSAATPPGGCRLRFHSRGGFLLFLSLKKLLFS